MQISNGRSFFSHTFDASVFLLKILVTPYGWIMVGSLACMIFGTDGRWDDDGIGECYGQVFVDFQKCLSEVDTHQWPTGLVDIDD